MHGTFELRVAREAYLRIACSAVPLGLVMVAFAYAWGVPHGDGDPYGFRLDRHVVALTAWVLGAVASACGLFAMRDRGARITWNESGITEWRGTAPRVAMPWSTVRHVATHARLDRQGRQTKGMHTIEQFDDGRGRTITIASSLAVVPRWLLRCNATGPVGAIAQAAQLPRGERVRPASVGTRSIAWTTWLARLGYVPLCVFASSLLSGPAAARGSLAEVLVLVTVPLLLRCIRPIAELVRLRREARPFARARPIELIDNDDAIVRAKERDQRVFTFDSARLFHDDGLLHLRRGHAWIVAPELEREEVTVPYREAAERVPMLEVLRLEHDGIRTARGALVFAVWLELLVRLLVAIGPAIGCVILALSMLE